MRNTVLFGLNNGNKLLKSVNCIFTDASGIALHHHYLANYIVWMILYQLGNDLAVTPLF